ncbi:MAG: hypothetical protein V1698_03100 [bacterium]
MAGNLFQTIYVSAEEGVSAIIEKILATKVPKIFLAVPKKALLFSSPINLRILKEEADKRGVLLTIVTSDQTGQLLAQRSGIETAETLLNKKVDNMQKKKPRIWMSRGEKDKENSFQQISRSESSSFAQNFQEAGQVKKKSLKNKFIFAACFMVISLALFFAFFNLPFANVLISCQVQPFQKELDLYIKAAENVAILDQKNVILGRVLEEEKKIAQNFSVTGQREIEKYAEGEIEIINEWDSSSQTFVKGTKLVSDDGKIFSLAQATTIPGFSRSGGQDLAGKAMAKVIAQKPGISYNINVQKLHFSAFKETSKYEKVFANLTNGASGGELGKETVVSQEDIEKGKEFFASQIKNNLSQDFFELENGQILVENSDNFQISNLQIGAKLGDAVKQFEITANLHRRAWVVDEERLGSFLKEALSSEIGENDFQIDKNTEIVFLENSKDYCKAKLKVSGIISKNISSEEVKGRLLGKDRQEAEKLLGELSSVSGFSLKFWPFWSKKVPANGERVNIFLDRNNYFSIIN